MLDEGRPLPFDLAADIGQRTDVIAAHREVATRLHTALSGCQADVDAEAKQRPPR